MNPLKPITDFFSGVTDPITGADDVKAAQEQLQKIYQQNIEMLQAYRPKALEAREQGMAHTLGAYGPSNEMLKRMYGEEFGLDLEALGNPGVAEILGDPSAVPTPSGMGTGPGGQSLEEKYAGLPEGAERLENTLYGQLGGDPNLVLHNLTPEQMDDVKAAPDVYQPVLKKAIHKYNEKENKKTRENQLDAEYTRDQQKKAAEKRRREIAGR